MSFIVPMEKPNRCGRCPCFHAEHPMYCQAVKADKNKRIYAPYGEGRPDWCPLIEVPPHGRLIDADKLKRHIDKLPALPDGNFAGTHRNLKALINMQKTVIEAEGREE